MINLPSQRTYTPYPREGPHDTRRVFPTDR
jgi:hypothetical protein